MTDAAELLARMSTLNNEEQEALHNAIRPKISQLAPFDSQNDAFCQIRMDLLEGVPVIRAEQVKNWDAKFLVDTLNRLAGGETPVAHVIKADTSGFNVLHVNHVGHEVAISADFLLKNPRLEEIAAQLNPLMQARKAALDDIQTLDSVDKPLNLNTRHVVISNTRTFFDTGLLSQPGSDGIIRQFFGLPEEAEIKGSYGGSTTTIIPLDAFVQKMQEEQKSAADLLGELQSQLQEVKTQKEQAYLAANPQIGYAQSLQSALGDDFPGIFPDDQGGVTIQTEHSLYAAALAAVLQNTVKRMPQQPEDGNATLRQNLAAHITQSGDGMKKVVLSPEMAKYLAENSQAFAAALAQGQGSSRGK